MRENTSHGENNMSADSLAIYRWFNDHPTTDDDYFKLWQWADEMAENGIPEEVILIELTQFYNDEIRRLDTPE